jgi:hypothetical protein
MTNVDPVLVAARLRGLLGSPTPEEIPDIARTLGVSDVALQASLDSVAPHPTLTVIIAVIQRYGVDPTWVVTGEYDVSRHRTALGDEDPAPAAVIAQLINAAATPSNPLDLRRLHFPL